VAVELSPLVRRVVANNPSAYTYQGTCTYLIGRGDLAVVDPGPSDEAHMRALLAAVRRDERITQIFVTHTHTDHASAARTLQAKTGGEICGFGPRLRTEQPAVTMPFDRELRDGEVVAGRTWTLEAVHTPGHASDHICYALKEEGVLCTGDHVMGWATTVVPPPDGRLADYLASLEKLLLRAGDNHYLPGHGPAISDPHRLVRAFLTHRRERNEQILSAVGEGTATVPDLVRRIYDENRKTVWPAAAASVYAHLLYLLETGRIDLVGDDVVQRSSRFRRRA
jgi:glyoxylase-like metal-dependent hydrolase (beta-lactamase superfamily II)